MTTLGTSTGMMKVFSFHPLPLRGPKGLMESNLNPVEKDRLH